MLNSLITSQTRIKLLLKFFLNPKNRGYLRQLASEFGESTNSIRIELNKLTDAKILTSKSEGRNVIYNANTTHPLFDDIRSIVLKSTGIDKVVNDIIKKLGSIDLAFIRGDYATGKDSGLIDLVLVGEQINTQEMERVRQKTEALIDRKIAVLILTPSEFEGLKDAIKDENILILK
ncbi:MAG: ArsR family transcriptional regulator [Calditrichae bacterium]|nr:ArsR family transcriptional regulator [Calditrichota bacterium]MCB9059582.1 ArsR family transcriptional regulator [Calditrichia bacterium]